MRDVALINLVLPKRCDVTMPGNGSALDSTGSGGRGCVCVCVCLPSTAPGSMSNLSAPSNSMGSAHSQELMETPLADTANIPIMPSCTHTLTLQTLLGISFPLQRSQLRWRAFWWFDLAVGWHQRNHHHPRHNHHGGNPHQCWKKGSPVTAVLHV